MYKKNREIVSAPKIASPLLPVDYRPISALPLFFTVLENRNATTCTPISILGPNQSDQFASRPTSPLVDSPLVQLLSLWFTLSLTIMLVTEPNVLLIFLCV